MPGQVSNGEKAFRKATETVGNIADILDLIGFAIPELKLISKGGKLITNAMKTSTDISDMIQHKYDWGDNAIDKGTKIVDFAKRASSFAGLDSEEIISNPLDFVLDAVGTGFDIAGIVRSSDNTGNKVLRSIESVVSNFTPMGKAVKLAQSVENNLPTVYNSFAGNSHGIGSPDMARYQQTATKYLYGGPGTGTYW
jgi:hypothetical protein